MEWERDETLLAERLDAHKIPGILKKTFKTGENEALVLEKSGGEIHMVRGEKGEHDVSGYEHLVLIDTREREMEREVRNVSLSEGKYINVKFVISFRVSDEALFTEKVMHGRRRLFLDDLWNDTLSDFFYRKTASDMMKVSSADMEGEKSGGLKKAILEDARKFFNSRGISVLSADVSFSLK